MKMLNISIPTILMVLTLVGSIGALTLQYQQQVYAPRQCPNCSEFRQHTHEFVAAGARLILEFIPALPPSESDQFLKLSANFERDVVLAVINDHDSSGDPIIPNLLDKYIGDVLKIFPPHQPWLELLQDYRGDVLGLFFGGSD